MTGGALQDRIIPARHSLPHAVFALWCRHGVPPWRQFSDILTLVYLRQQMLLGEYFLWFPPEYRHRPGGRTLADHVGEYGSGLWINQALRLGVPQATIDLLQDKLATAAALAHVGVRVPETLAVCGASQSLQARGTAVLRDAASLAGFLRDASRYPIFGKPNATDMSIGAVSMTAYDPPSDRIAMLGRRAAAPDALAEEILTAHPDGYLLQRCIRQAPAVEAVCGTGVGAIRAVCIRDDGAVRLAYAAWKIPAPASATDHPDLPGAVIADIDPETGRIGRMQVGLGLAARPVDGPPGLGRPLRGTIVPGWRDLVQTVQTAMAIVPNAVVVGWDVALGTEGPVILEGNWRPSHTIYQAASGRGALTLDLAEIARRRGAANLSANPTRREAGFARRLINVVRRFGPQPPAGRG